MKSSISPVTLSSTCGLKNGGPLTRSVSYLTHRLVHLAGNPSWLSMDVIKKKAGSPPSLADELPYIVVPEITLADPKATFEFAIGLIERSTELKGWKLEKFLGNSAMRFHFPSNTEFVPHNIQWKVVDLVGRPAPRKNAAGVNQTLGEATKDLNTPGFAALYALAIHEYLTIIGQEAGGGVIPPLIIPTIEFDIRPEVELAPTGFLALSSNEGAKRVILDYVLSNSTNFSGYGIPIAGTLPQKVVQIRRQQHQHLQPPFQNIQAGAAVAAVA